jgi:hypothetical protein
MGLEASGLASGAGTVSTAAQALQVAGVVGSTVAAYQKSKAEQDAYEYRSRIAANNAQLADWQAADAVTRGQDAENRQRQKTAQLKGTQRASLAARGIDLGEGSALDILTGTDVLGETDALTLRANAAREAWGYRAQANQYRNDAAMSSRMASSRSPFGDAVGTLLTSGGTVAAKWYGMRQSKDPGFTMSSTGHAGSYGYAPGAFPQE